MIKVMNRYYIEVEDRELCRQRDVSIEEYLIATFSSDIADVDADFACDVALLAMKAELHCEDADETGQGLDEWAVWLEVANKDIKRCEQLVTALIDFTHTSDWVIVK